MFQHNIRLKIIEFSFCYFMDYLMWVLSIGVKYFLEFICNINYLRFTLFINSNLIHDISEIKFLHELMFSIFPIYKCLLLSNNDMKFILNLSCHCIYNYFPPIFLLPSTLSLSILVSLILGKHFYSVVYTLLWEA